MNWQQTLKRLVLDGIRAATRPGRRGTRTGGRTQPAPDLVEPRPSERFDRPAPPSQSTEYPGDYTGHLEPVYDPHLDGLPDPGEIVWTWVPYEEDHTQGKDRPVLLVGRDGDWLLGLQVTSQDHDRDAAQEARAGRYWVDIGSGDWDHRRRESEVRVNRFIRIDPSAVRRIGAVLDKERFDEVAAGVARWS
ncbi:type II toxin-antitoxin system PemK/MazF family toxin [uncultured Tessaracoccus sp.]|uniref:type II toxin-antitoxin system PemK/MazF family toxin n=1 Tax=uncultured Tessaracoccus sp. TaxID=905023 RepID=UPI0025CBC81B|nr:type II toxin-antitoxin system PemK/MazF family toxin [uncultured Tessaracoccus sp.]